MDQYTADLLVKWGLLEYVDIFAEARIDTTSLQLLEDADLASLVTPLGDRLKLQRNLSIWKRELSQADTEKRIDLSPMVPEISSRFLNSVLQDLDACSSPSPQTPNHHIVEGLTDAAYEVEEPRINNSVLSILNKYSEGRAVIHKGRNSNGLLNAELRRQLANLIIKHIMENEPNKALQGPDFLKLAHEIHELFPQESPAIYYAPYLSQTKYQAKRNASGILYNTYASRKRHLRNLGILPPILRSRSNSRASSKSTTDTSSPDLIVPATGIQISQLQQSDPSVCEEHLTILESPDPGPWQDIEKYWSSTVCARLRYLYYEKGTLTDYFNRFPILKSSSGYTLLQQDYEKLYPANTNGINNLSALSSKIIDIAKAKSKTATDRTITKTIQSYLDVIDENNAEDVCLLLLPYIVNIPSVRRKGAWKPSRAEFRDGFAINAASDAEVRPIIVERRNKLSQLGLTFQPIVIYCGDIKNITKAYAVCDDVLYDFRSLNKAVDVVFKIFHATGAQYPQESYDVWLLLQIAFYDLHTQFDRQSASLKQVLVDLGFKDKIK